MLRPCRRARQATGTKPRCLLERREAFGTSLQSGISFSLDSCAESLAVPAFRRVEQEREVRHTAA